MLSERSISNVSWIDNRLRFFLRQPARHLNYHPAGGNDRQKGALK